MTTQDVLINFVLDASSSMGSQRDGTISGVREFLAEQAALPGKTRLSLTLFNTAFDARFVGKNVAKLAEFGSDANPYIPAGMTALLDAVGYTIRGTEAWLEAHPKFDGRVMCVILTDGQENASRQWHINSSSPVAVGSVAPIQPAPWQVGDPWVAPLPRGVLPRDRRIGAGPAHQPGDAFDLGALIKAKQESGWEFVFLGAGGSDWLERTFSAYVPKGSIVRSAASNSGARQTYAGVSAAMTRSRVAGSAFQVDQDEVLTPNS